MEYSKAAVLETWPSRYPEPEITEYEHGIKVEIDPPENAETPWLIRIQANRQSG